MLVSISEAAKLAGVSRSHLYSKYINTGLLTVDRTTPDKPMVDTSEVLRVFGCLQSDCKQPVNVLQEITPDNTLNTALLEQELRHVQELLAVERERNEDLRRMLLMLEHKPPEQTVPKKKKWWQWGE